MSKAKEVRWEHLKGRDAMRRLKRKPVVFLPIGCLERHGSHLPMGLDALKAHAVCCECASRIGGLVFPAHFYAGIHFVPDSNRSEERRQRLRNRKHTQEWGNLYTEETAEKHLIEILTQLREIGARVVVLYSGHYPVAQREMIHRIAARFNRGPRPSLVVIAFDERTFFGDGDHAGLWETSLFLALRPEEVDMSRIGPHEFADHGWTEKNDPRKASAEFGTRAIRQIVAFLKKEIAKTSN